MNIEKCTKESFVVIGKEGSTMDGNGFISALWEDANLHFDEIKHLAKLDDGGNIAGVWGAMTDMSRSFKPWEDNFSKGLYLAGLECNNSADAPKGWTKWIVPGYEYLYVVCEGPDTFLQMIDYMKKNDIELVGAVHDFTCPETGKNYMFFPIAVL